MKTLKFVAMGDSLTVGFIPTRMATRPYTQFLKVLLVDFLEETGWRELLEVNIVNRGINGNLTGDMLLRFERDVLDSYPNYVILLGGTNDVGWGFPIRGIFANLKRMYEIAIERQIEPIGCTVPSIVGWDEGILPRLELNQLIKHHCHEMGIVCADLFETTQDSDTQRLSSDYTSDGLHLNESGYKRVAETLFEEAIRGLLIRDIPS